MSEEEVNAGLRERAAERKRNALAKVQTLDLSQTTWPELPHPRVVNAITYVARRGLYRYPHLSGSELRGVLAERHGVPADRLILGNGAAELLSSATRALIEPGQRLLTPWPSYPLYPLMARRAHGRPERVSGGIDELLAASREDDVRVIALASPNDPTGELLATAELRRLLEGLRQGVGCAARRGARGLRRRPAARLLAGAGRGVPAAARVPQLLQGLGPGGPADRLRDRGPGRGGAAGRARPRPRRLGGLPGRRAGGDPQHRRADRCPCPRRLRARAWS